MPLSPHHCETHLDTRTVMYVSTLQETQQVQCPAGEGGVMHQVHKHMHETCMGNRAGCTHCLPGMSVVTGLETVSASDSLCWALAELLEPAEDE